jgi:hypothetical protein
MKGRRRVWRKCVLLASLFFLVEGSFTSGLAWGDARHVAAEFESALSKTEPTVTQQVYAEPTPDQALLSGPSGILREDTAKRTRNSKTYVTKDGSFQTIVSLTDYHYEDTAGNWQDIQLALTDEADMANTALPLSQDASRAVLQLKQKGQLAAQSRKETSYKALQVPFDLTLPKTFTKGYSIERNAEKLTFLPIGANSVTGSVYGKDQVLYSQAWNHTDVRLEVKPTGIKESIVLHDSSAPTTFTYEVIGYDSIGKELYLDKPWLEDATGTKRDVTQAISKQGNRTYLSLQADTSGLKFPITIDPTVSTVSPSRDFYIYCTNNSTPACYGQNNMMLTFGNISVSYIFFDLSSIPSNANFSNATLHLYSSYNTPADESLDSTVYRVTENWNEMDTWIKNPTQYDYNNPILKKTITKYEAHTEWDITSAVRKWVSGEWINYGLAVGGRSYKDGDTSYYSREWEMYGSGTGPKLVLTYNLPASPPKVLSPNGGEVFDSQQLITWSPAVDPDNVQNSLTYQLQLSTNGGASWTDLLAPSAAGATSFGYTFSAIPDTTTALVRVRAFDGIDYGPWDQSDGYFSIRHNKAPNVPANRSPGSSSSAALLAGTTPVLNWSFSDPDAGDYQSAYTISLYNAANALIYNSGWISSSLTSFTVPEGKLSRNATYSWNVQVKDSKGTLSPLSPALFIKMNSLPNLTITSYADGQSIPDNILTFTWSYSDGDGQPQAKYQVVGSKDNWKTWAYNSGERSGSALTFTSPPLSNGSWNIAIRGFDGMEWSDWNYRTNLTLPNSFEPNDSTGNATPILYGNTYTTYLVTSTDVDYFKYTASANGGTACSSPPRPGRTTTYMSMTNRIICSLLGSEALEPGRT